jgi:ribosomal-protein-alanine N-acetyltransferase
MRHPKAHNSTGNISPQPQSDLLSSSVATLPLYQAAGFELRLPNENDAALIAAFAERNSQRHEPPLLPPACGARSGEQSAAALSSAIDFWRREIRVIQRDARLCTDFRCYLFLAQTPRVVGSVSLCRVQRGVRHDACLGFVLDEQSEGRGLMLQAASYLVQFAFEELGLQRVEATCRPENERSARLLQRLGFLRVGVIPNYVLFGSTWCDAVLNSLSRPDWEKHRAISPPPHAD